MMTRLKSTIWAYKTKLSKSSDLNKKFCSNKCLIWCIEMSCLICNEMTKFDLMYIIYWVRWLCSCILINIMMFWYISITTCFFKIMMSICSDFIIFMLLSILALRSSTRWIFYVIITFTFWWFDVSIRCIDTMMYLLIICLSESISHISISIIIVQIFTLTYWLLKNV